MTLAQLVFEPQQQAGRHLGVGERAVEAAGNRQPGVLDQRAEPVRVELLQVDAPERTVREIFDFDRESATLST